MRWKLLTLPAAGLAAIAARVAGSLGLVAAANADERRIGRGRPSTPASRESRTAGHELEDFSARTVATVLGTIAVSYAILIGGVFFMVHHLSGHDRQMYAKFTPQQTARITPPTPRVQVHPIEDYLAYRRAQLARLYHYDRLGNGYARIPIPRAMALEIGHGLGAPADTGAGPPGGGKSGSGKSGGGNAGTHSGGGNG